jgi:hypothetical protein
MELVRLAIPRRLNTQSHIDYLAEMVAMVKEVAWGLRGYKIPCSAGFQPAPPSPRAQAGSLRYTGDYPLLRNTPDQITVASSRGSTEAT